MASQPKWNGEDRRQSPRVAGKGAIKAAVADEFGQSRTVLRQTQVVNVSGGGLAFTSAEDVPVGSTVNIRTQEQQTNPFCIRIVGADRRNDDHCELRGQLVQGSIPACLMYDW